MEQIEKTIQRFANSVPEQTKANTEVEHDFNRDTNALIEAFANIDAISNKQSISIEFARTLRETLKD